MTWPASFSEADEDASRVLEYMTSTEYGEAQAPSGGFISPRRSVDPSAYPNETMRQIAEIAYTATEFKFDGSDQMPGEVGSGSFWRGMVGWVGGAGAADGPDADRGELAGLLTCSTSTFPAGGRPG